MKKTFISWCLIFATSPLAVGQLQTATFEDLDLGTNTYWCGELDEEDEDLGFSQSWFSSGSFDFNNFYWPKYYTWSFFAYSSRTEKTFTSYTDDQFNSITGCGANDSRIFGVAFPASYMGKTIMEIVDTDQPTVVPGMQIVNTAWVVDCILNGDGYEGPFKTGDWMKLTLTGYANEELTATADYYLADYRSADETEHYYLDEWTWIDLSTLGAVNEIHFSIDSSKANAYGVTTPTYVCIDNVGITKEDSGVDKILSNSDLNLRYIGGSHHVAVSGIANEARYVVADMSGRTVMSGTLRARNASIDLSTLSSGLYIVSVADSNASKSLKIVM